MQILIDTNVVLDFLLDREPFIEDAEILFQRIDADQIDGFIAATTLTNIYYIVRKAEGFKVAQETIAQILADLQICPVDRQILEYSVALNFRDFEDAVQCACAIAQNVDAIVTRDPKDFVNSTIPVLSPRQLRDQLASRS